MIDASPPSALAPVKCLLVDDLEENLLALGELLKTPDIDLLKARSGSQALELLLSHDIALVLLDVQMPGMDGFEVAEFMRGSKRTRHVPIIFITASTRDQLRLFKGYEAGAVDFLHKPVEPHILRSKVDVFVELHRQRLRLAEELRDRTETLRLSQMFMAVLGHDLRSPLSTIMVGAALLQSSQTPERIEQVSNLIVTSGERMRTMISDLLDVARARMGGGIPVQLQPVDLGAIVARVVEEQRVLFPQRALLSETDGTLDGHWDPDRLAQMITNLAGNALHHGQADAPVIIGVDGTRSDEVVVRVSNGGAIPPDVVEHLFDPFHGSQRPRGRNDGLGLGLYIAERIAVAHLGEIHVDTGEAQGTTIAVTLPRHPPLQQARASQAVDRGIAASG